MLIGLARSERRHGWMVTLFHVDDLALSVHLGELTAHFDNPHNAESARLANVPPNPSKELPSL
jgi:hypothetical protein